MTKIATWNLHHMARQLEIPEGVVAVIKHVRPDVLVLHDAPATDAIRDLQQAGYQLVPADGGLDRALVSAAVSLRGWQIVEAAAGHRLTGEGGLSDHPMLVVEIE